MTIPGHHGLFDNYSPKLPKLVLSKYQTQCRTITRGTA